MPAEPASGLWRSEDMSLLQLHLQREAAYDTVLTIGRLGCAQFRDMNPTVSAFSRMFINDVRRCEDCERRLRYLDDQLRRDYARRARATAAQIAAGADPQTASRDLGTETLDTLEPKLEATESELRDLNAKAEQLLTQQNNLREYLEILTQEPTFFRDDAEGGAGVSAVGAGDEITRSGGLRYITGVVLSARAALFERLIYRATRGNMFMRTNAAKEKFEDPGTGEQVEKTVFVVFFSSQRAQDKIKKIAESLGVALYPYTIGSPAEKENTNKVRVQLGEMKATLKATHDVRLDVVQKVALNIYQWRKVIIVAKSVYGVLNLLSFRGQTVVAQCWAPTADLDRLREALQEAEKSSGARVKSLMEPLETKESPPTYFKTNKFTSTHQGIVDAYGIARYKEVNPACFSVVTFPFLFGVMYGDVGHGVLLTLLAAVFIIFEQRLLRSNLNEIIAIVFGGRYVLILMGLFAIYLGFLYNDVFGLMISPFGTPYWYFPTSVKDAQMNCDPAYVKWYGQYAKLTRGCKVKGGYTNIMGVDSGWSETENKLEFMNGLKMKMAVILGVVQMLFGLGLQLMNHRYFGEWKHIWFGFVPEVIFLVATFGYMCFMIMLKWIIDWPSRMLQHLTPPSLLEGMTNFFLAPGSVAADRYLFGGAGFQNFIQILLLLAAFISVPMMLIPIPYFEYKHHQHMLAIEAGGEGEMEQAPLIAKKGVKDEESAGLEASGAAHEEPFDMSEVVIKQVIHTIEFVLGCVSNTASYLRLWALSLAHAELSDVFWNFAWLRPLTADGVIPFIPTGVVTFIGYAIWAGATVGVLGVMESLSAFLHALRLHWVEFQNKFYYGDGIQFVPYDINVLCAKPYETVVLE